MRVIIAGGGTGGHLFPGVAVADEIKSRYPEAEVVFVGTSRGIEARVLPKLGWRLELIKVSGIKTGSMFRRLLGVFSIPRAMFQSWRILRREKPVAVLGVGGYASGPCVLMAWMRRTPTAVLEQNSIPGFTNKVLGKFVKRVFIAFDKTRSYFRKKKTKLVGNPVRAQIASVASADGPSHGKNVFVFGGSLGARAINRAIVDVAEELHGEGISLFHQTGKTDYDATILAYQERNLDVDCQAFVEDMAEKYRWCDVIVSRAGATTVAELGLVGKPAILIPYPHAADDHQTYNAQELADAGAAIVITQSDLTPDSLRQAIQNCLEPETNKKMSEAMISHGKPKASAAIVDWIESVSK